MMNRRSLLLTAAAASVASTTAQAHHGWRWTTGRNIRLLGLIATARLGNPHGVLTVDAEGDIWTVEVGQPWRNQRAGLSDADFAIGREITIEGEPSAQIDDRKMKAERIWFDGTRHELYPERS